LRVPLDPGSDVPLFRQIEAHLRRAIDRGRLPAGSRLPSTRSLAQDLGVNRLTVESAYGELTVDGVVAARPGSGTYVLEAPPRPPAPFPRVEPRCQREALARLGLAPAPGSTAARAGGRDRRGVVALDGGSSDPSLFPVASFRKVVQRIMRRDGSAAFGYGEPGGRRGLRDAVARLLTAQGLPATAEQVLVTGGSQRAIALVARLLLRPGETVAVEEPTYGGALELFRAHGLRVVGVATDEQGLRVDALEAVVRRERPRLLYVVPTFQNPTGACLPAARRQAVLALAARHGLPVLEDDYVGDLRFEGRAQAALKASDPGGLVVYVSTFSKMLMPGLRVGFLVADGPIREALLRLQHAEEIGPGELFQAAVEEFVTVGRYQSHLRRMVRHYRRRRDAALGAVRRHLPGCVVRAPTGGLFLWVRLPPGVRSDRLLPRAEEEGVRFAPGGLFFPVPEDGAPFVRLCFAAHDPGALEEGVRRLGVAVGRARRSAR